MNTHEISISLLFLVISAGCSTQNTEILTEDQIPDEWFESDQGVVIVSDWEDDCANLGLTEEEKPWCPVFHGTVTYRSGNCPTGDWDTIVYGRTRFSSTDVIFYDYFEDDPDAVGTTFKKVNNNRYHNAETKTTLVFTHEGLKIINGKFPNVCTRIWVESGDPK
ncbi:MAG: hypothetical protein OEV06_03165 [Anaerolineae bacterium]|nr:hypothetical protein [Anaerolineae bacterium]